MLRFSNRSLKASRIFFLLERSQKPTLGDKDAIGVFPKWN